MFGTQVARTLVLLVIVCATANLPGTASYYLSGTNAGEDSFEDEVFQPVGFDAAIEPEGEAVEFGERGLSNTKK
eukprot:CAMPEP_0202453996 /NCGR_PEP_ID=MMETSP1360-20130828/11840_1 /ASSEMBLY_ACC=CAM_ASM_000848 /TAXON_ID=515479 /ORGANISM="Licmophora paradoxa, Strain CCMP2313" /LENGTH=73 /DNA_ID=CAMNT_0049073209 /DNA_START=420 /DNA_END=638 /DNA_ORIENTATION=-